MAITKEDMLIFVNSTNNNNKFYHIKLIDNCFLETTYGRVGTKGVKNNKNGTLKDYTKLINSKLKKGYEIAKITLESNSTDINLLDIAMKQIKYTNDNVKLLIERLVNKNIHNITSSTNISFNKKSNLFQTPIGPVTLEGIQKAKDILYKIQQNPSLTINDTHFIKQNELKKIIMVMMKVFLKLI